MSHSRRDIIKNLSAGAALLVSSQSSLANQMTRKSDVLAKPNKDAIKAPKKLSYGDTIGLVAPATVLSPGQLDWAIETVNRLGFNVKLGKNVRKQYGYFAGTDKQRASDLNNMFADDSVDAIWCVKGGWGAARTLDLLDFDLIKRNPKMVIGYSDITSLLNALYEKADLVTYHGPNAVYGESEYTETILVDTLLGEGGVIESHVDAKIETITPGVAVGPLVGGNLSVFTSMIGSDYFPSVKNSILFLEDVSEPAYKVDRMMSQLKLAGVLDQVSGVVFGTCNRCVGSEEAFTVEEVIANWLRPLAIPAVMGVSVGHVLHKMTVPIGVNAQLNADNGTILVNRYR